MIINNEVYLAIIISVASAVFGQYFIKKLASLESISRTLNVMFFFCVILAGLISLSFGSGLRINIFVIGLGVLNAWVAWLWWRAIEVSLSQTMLFLPLTGFTGVFLTATFLGEWGFLNPLNFSGALTLLGAFGLLGSIFFFRGSWQEGKKVRRIWLWCIIGQSILGGVIIFLMKFFALQEISKTNFIFSWYLGALLGSFVLLILERNFKIWLPQKGPWLSYFLLSVATLIAVLTSYWSLELAPATLVLPLSQFFTVLSSALVGLFIFHERKSFGRQDWLGTAVGAISLIFLILGMTNSF